MKKLELVYEGKAKQLFTTERDDVYVMRYKDDATAFNGIKRAHIPNKGKLNNAISTLLFHQLHKKSEVFDNKSLKVYTMPN